MNNKLVLYQRYKNRGMIIVDDILLDNSNKIIEEYSKKEVSIKHIRLEKNKVRNGEIKEAKCIYMAFGDSDDFWTPDKLFKQVSFMQEYHIALSYADYSNIDEKSLNVI